MNNRHIKALTIQEIQGFIDILVNGQLEYGERDDAAMDLGQANVGIAKQALIKVASNANEEEGLLESCGESLLEIWDREGCGIDLNIINSLALPARQFIILSLESRKAHV